MLISAHDSGRDAVRTLASRRQAAPAVNDALASASSSAKGPSVIAFEGIGDEAFWDYHTGGVNVRVRNVVATIHVSLSDSAVSDRDPAQMDLERRVAQEVARGLSGR